MTMMDKITQSLQQRRNNGGCSMWREVGIPKMVNLGNWNKLKDWEKEYFLDGVSKLKSNLKFQLAFYFSVIITWRNFVTQ